MLYMLQKCSILKVAAVFFDEPTKEHYLIEVSKKSKLAHTSVKRHLDALKKLEVIKEYVEEKGNRQYPIYKANINNDAYRYYKKILNMMQLKELVRYLKDNLMPKSIILFGSYQKGEDIEGSDIDIFVECKEEKIDLIRFRKQLNRNIELHFKKNFNEYPKELKNNIINGTILDGYLEVF